MHYPISAAGVDIAPRVVVENRLPGSSGWLVGMNGSRAADDVRLQIKGFASVSSVEVGASIDFHVSVAAAEEFTVQIYRLGYYGGRGARKITESPRLRGVSQPALEHDASTGLITCPWPVSWTLPVGVDWVSGLHLAVFTTTSGWRSYAPFVVRDPAQPAALCVVIPSTTYQAHNQWPLDQRSGRSLYYGYRPEGGGRGHEHRAVKVSFDRPYAGNGLPGHLNYDQEFIRWAEQEGLDLTYVDSVDLHAGRVDPGQYRGLVFCGHDAYWSDSMRAVAERGVAAGTSLAFLTASHGYWNIRLEPGPTGRDDRVVVCYKSPEDPAPDVATGKWRSGAPFPAAPEQALLGVQYRATATHPVPLVVRHADHWFWHGAGVVDGDEIEGVVGGAADAHDPKAPVPRAAQTLLAESPFTALGGAEQTQNTSICEHPNGSVVFVSGSMHWPLALAPYDRGDQRVRTATANLLHRIVGGSADTPRALVAAAAPVNPVAAENRQPGSAAWLMGMDGSKLADDVKLQVKGFASASSVPIGGSLDFHVTVAAAESFTVGIYRMGYYDGKGARKIVESPALPGTVQPAPEHDPETGLITCPWSVSWTLPVGADWVSGVYVAVFTTASGWRSYTTFVVRDPSRRAALCAVVASTTYQAYNQWPYDKVLGRSLYHGFEPGSGRALHDLRAFSVSFDRPYAHSGLPSRFEFDRDFIRWAEREGFDLSYVDSIDLHAGRVDPQLYEGLVFFGHDEYWSDAMRATAERAVGSGTSLAYLTANNVYWHIRVHAAADGRADRVMVCYKSADDPEPDKSGWTCMWRERWVGPNRPEQALLGVQFNGVVAYPAPLVVQRADHWFWAGSGVADGQQLDAVVGGEADGVDPEYPSPTGGTRTLLSASPYRVSEGDAPLPDDDEQAYRTQNASAWEADNGAIVFVSGSLDWPAALGRVGRIDPHIQVATGNLLRRIAAAGN